ncbi:hypothetical protein TIFTF001_056262 [Ficus carica]|uniref:Uncharacterized protein n=1 Tax=Ficus carica TaxID=3494 RepID=A0AA88EJ23_FICCA|nr:hypothetical protein TIFTF001_056262 [Ficus carica]
MEKTGGEKDNMR